MTVHELSLAFDCRFCRERFTIPRHVWKLKRSAIPCPHCRKVADYGQMDILETIEEFAE